MAPSVDNPLLSANAMQKITNSDKSASGSDVATSEANGVLYPIDPKQFLGGNKDDSKDSRIPKTEKETWDNTISKVISGIVSIKTTIMRSFDTEIPGDYTATGFVIDAKEGLILSNRHVVSPAPINAVAVFLNYEEVPIIPIWRDPVHDYGIFRYDPNKLQHIEVHEIPLRPDLATVGTEIKVIGCDAGEKLSILGSTLARLDRQAPFYGRAMFNDFNTFYLQAASGTSGGSSGSPVLNINGQAVALNAGGSNTSQSSFYLPLDWVVRVVDKIKKGEPVTRGTLQTEFLQESYDELKKLGLNEEEAKACRIRNPSANGLLTVSRVLKEGPACAFRKVPPKIPHGDDDGIKYVPGLEPCDILLKCSDVFVVDFISLWDIIDSHVGKEIKLEIVRGTKHFRCIVTVQDLHSITPDRFLEYGGAIIHELSYQMARTCAEPLGKGVFCAASGFMYWSSWSRGFLITDVNGTPTPDLDSFVEAIKKIPDYKRIPIRTRQLGNLDESISLIQMDWHYWSASTFVRNDVEGTWDRYDILSPEDDSTGIASVIDLLPPQSAIVEQLSVPDALNISTSTSTESMAILADQAVALDGENSSTQEDIQEEATQDLILSMANAQSYLPLSAYGESSNSGFNGVGLIVSLDPIPLIIFGRDAVPSEMADIRLTIQHKQVPGYVVYLGAFVFVTFDRSLLPASCVLTVPAWDDKPLRVREEVKLFGQTTDQLLQTSETSIRSITPLSSWAGDPPQYRPINMEAIFVVEGGRWNWGVILTRKAPLKKLVKGEKIKVAAILLSSNQYINLQDYVFPIVDKINSEGPRRYNPETWNLGVEFSTLTLSHVSSLGLSDERFAAYVHEARKIRDSPRPIDIKSRLQPPVEEPSEEEEELGLKVTDIVLEIDGQFFHRLSQLVHMDFSKKRTVDVLVLRNRKEILLKVPTVKAWPSGYDVVAMCFGAIVHGTHSAALEMVSKSAKLVPLKSDGIYIGGVMYGSPALKGLYATMWILEVDDIPVGSVQDLLKVVEKKKWVQGQYVRIKQVNRKGITSVVSIKVDDRFWPCISWSRNTVSGKWTHKKHTGEEFNLAAGKK